MTRLHGLIFVPLLFLYTVCLISGQKPKKNGPTSNCKEESCYPSTGDLMVGRDDRLVSSSTCGLTRPERFCIVSHLEDQQNQCFICDSRDPDNKKSHRVENIVSSTKRSWKNKWWQAENGVGNVSIQLDLEAEFHFTHIILKFKTFRPKAMLIERSYDFGKTWKVYRYFAHNCADSFPGIQTGAVKNIQTVICESKYSEVYPSSEGEVIFGVIPANLKIHDPYSQEVQDLLKITNLRLNFTKLHTLGDNLLTSGEEVKEKYYHSLYNMVVMGKCSCYGHASRCNPLPGQKDRSDMVHGQCECTHFTKGANCEQCMDFYNELPWRPALGRKSNPCKKCDCNEHSTKCHFDAAVFGATNQVSGGVCDDCQHNTMGRHCEQCKPFFFHDPDRSITDPYACQSCDCDPIGSEQNGECESRTDPDIGAVAGRCKCKYYVHGKRCDTCKQGFWNLNNANPYGCEDCNCNPLGTVEGRECNMYTGRCECKRYVKGKHCDECIEGYWHLSSHPQGCVACDCDIGGSYNYSCSQYDGSCSCRPNIVGQQCKDSAVGYFVPGLDWLIYEGEHATPTGRANIEYRLAPPDIHRSWTGPGFMRVHEGSTLEFYVNDIPHSTHYDVVVRYEPQTNREWHDVKLSVIRTDHESLEGACANVVHGDTEASVEFQPTSRHWIVVPSSCLEKGKTYKIKLEFRNFRHDSASPDDSILIDSIVLMPSPDAHPVLQYSDPRNQREEYEHYRCDDAYLSPAYRAELYHLCRPIIFSMSSLIHDGAKACDCDPVGSVNMECDPIGGQCRCKPYVVGRRCDQCQAGSFGFGPAGCVACQCDDLGSMDPTCDDYTGQCKCNPNVDGMRCDRCVRGFFSFPYCMQCRCNGLADECDEETGKCLYCRDNSGGDDCSRCADGYYGDPRPGHGGCKPCFCPGGAGSGMQYADTCRMETGIGQVVCDCHPGYSGLNCAECAMNYFGDPLRPGGTCTKCFCNNNIDHYVPHSCDSTTGQCLRCLYDTEGHQCDRCRKGTFGDATVRDCKPCECNILGTNQTLMHDCDIYSGQCHCLPNVIGRKCDECAINHWKLASGLGCEACDCDKSGSRLDQCNLYDGQCDCIEGRGGRDCSQCPVLSWGDPTLGCKPCSCNPDGSTSAYCDKVTGQCECAKGVTGLNCDRCDRGTFGSLPHCTPCGECFDNWDRLINQLREDAQSQLMTGTDIKLSGPPGAFAKEFEDLETQLDEMKIHVASADVSSDYLEGVDKAIDNLSSKLKALEPNVTSFGLKIEEETTKLTDVYSKLGEIQANHDKLNDETKVFKENAQKIQEQDITGASASIRESYDKTSLLHAKLTDAESVKSTSVSFRTSAEYYLNQSSLSTESSDNGKEKNLDEVVDIVNTINDNIQTINVELCGGTGSPCHEDCGGASCGKCGGELCDDGAVTKAWSAKNTSKKAEEVLRSKQKSIASLYSTLKTSEKQCNQIITDAKSLELAANATKNSSESQGFYVKEKIELGEEHLEKEFITAVDVEDVVNQTLELTISLTPDEINKLSAEIQKTVEDLTDIDSILQATRNDIDNAEDLLHTAQRAYEEAVKVLNETKKAKELLDVSAKGHDATEELLNEFATKKDELSQKIDLLKENLNDIQNNSNLDSDKVSEIVHRIEIVNSSFARNEKKLNIAESQSNRSKEDAMKIDEDILKFEEKYNELMELLKSKEGKLKEFKTRTDLVIKRVTFGDDIQSKTNSMKQMVQECQQQQNSLKHYNTVVKELLDQSSKYLSEIKEKQSALLVCTG